MTAEPADSILVSFRSLGPHDQQDNLDITTLENCSLGYFRTGRIIHQMVV